MIGAYNLIWALVSTEIYFRFKKTSQSINLSGKCLLSKEGLF